MKYKVNEHPLIVGFGTCVTCSMRKLKVLGKSVGLCKTTKRKDQLYISLLVSIYGESSVKISTKRTHISWDMNENINKENKKNSGFGEALQ